jgi:hypothetical protein
MFALRLRDALLIALIAAAALPISAPYFHTPITDY